MPSCRLAPPDPVGFIDQCGYVSFLDRVRYFGEYLFVVQFHFLLYGLFKSRPLILSFSQRSLFDIHNHMSMLENKLGLATEVSDRVVDSGS